MELNLDKFRTSVHGLELISLNLFQAQPLQSDKIWELVVVIKTVVITARKRSLRGLCFYICLSVILFMGGGGLHPAGLPLGGSRSRGSASERVCIQGGLHPGVLCRPPSDTMVNEQAVRILLQCIFVGDCL